MKKIMINTSVMINKEDFTVLKDEFDIVPHAEFNNLNILESLGLFERLVALINDLKYLDDKIDLLCLESSHGGYIPIKTSSSYKNVFILNSDETNNII